jgi:ATP-dependent exoDNAse (exonuclease V) beta subunit
MIYLPVALDLPMPKYDLLLIDEAQDLSKCQQALAKKAGRRLVFVGDPKQALYGFCGADSKSLWNGSTKSYRRLREVASSCL